MVENALGKQPARQAGRERRAAVVPFAGNSDVAPGIRQVGERFRLKDINVMGPLLAMADVALVIPVEGTTISRTDRELLFEGVSAANNCFFCMDSHAAHARAIARREKWDGDIDAVTEDVKEGNFDRLSPKMRGLMTIVLDVRENKTEPEDMEQRGKNTDRALELGATQDDVDLAVFIAGFASMCNRFVDGFGSKTFSQTEAYGQTADAIAEYGYANRPAAR